MNTAMKKLMLGLSLAALTLGGAAYAQRQGGPGGQAGMPTADADADGVITRAEAQTAAGAMFARMDVNGDGKLDKDDREAARAAMRQQMFNRLDADNDGSISAEEFAAHEGPGEGRGPGMGPGMDGDRGPGKHRFSRKGMRGHPGGMMARMADTDKDGAISQAEFNAAAMKHFEMTDANKDGKVTAEEREAARSAMREHMKNGWKARNNAQ